MSDRNRLVPGFAGVSLPRGVRHEHFVVLLVAAAVRAVWYQRIGPVVVRDATRYVGWCRDLSVETLFGSRALVYSGYWLPYCGWLRATGYDAQGFVLVQLVLSALTCVFVYEAARVLVDGRAALAAAGAFVFQWQVYRWFVRPQSEFMMTFVMAVALWRLAVYHVDPSRRNRLLALGSLGWLAVVRPNGLPIVFGYLVYDTLPDTSGWRLNLFPSAKVNFGLATAAVAGIAYRLQFGWAMGSILTPWKRGIIITPDRLVYQYDPEPANTFVGFFVANFEHVVAIATLRGLWFFSPVMPGWSTSHALRSAVTLTPVLIGAALGIHRAVSYDRELLVLWGTPLAMMVVTAMGIWVAGWRNFLGPAVVVYSLFTGYYVSDAAAAHIGRVRDYLASPG